jgi:hypothetical protein
MAVTLTVSGQDYLYPTAGEPYWRPSVTQWAQAVTSAISGGPVPQSRLINTVSPLSGGGDLSADRTITTSMATNRLIGRGTAGTGVMEEIVLGTNLSFAGTTLNASASSPGGSNTQFQYNNSSAFGGTSGFTWDGTHFTLATNQEARFRASTNRVYSNATGEITIEASTLTNVGVAGDIQLGDGTLRTLLPQTTEKISLGSSANRFFNAFFGGDIDLDDGSNLVLDTGTGTKIGTATSQLLGFYNATPVAQQGATTDLATVLSNLGFRAAGTAFTLTTTGAVSTGALTCTTIDTGNGALELSRGTYTPTLTNVANMAASTAYQAQYLRVGNTVTVSGKVDVDPTLTATATQLGISLPIASNLGAQEDCAGCAFASGIASQGASVRGDAANNRAEMAWISTDVTNQPMYFTFTYEII